MATVEHIGMANIVLGRRAFPELLQGGLRRGPLTETIAPLLDPASDEARRQAADCTELRVALGEPGCFERVADLAIQQLAAGGH